MLVPSYRFTFPLLFAGVVLFALSSCYNPMESPNARLGAGGAPGEPRIVDFSLRIKEPPTRTILPVWQPKDFLYDLVMTTQMPGVEPIYENDYRWQDDQKILVTAGPWKIEMTGFLVGERGDRRKVAYGVLEVVITETNEKLPLEVFPLEEGEGAFDWEITFPDNLADAKMEFNLRPATGEGKLVETVPLLPDSPGDGTPFTKSGKTILPAGNYFVNFRFEKKSTLADQPPSSYVVSHDLHIYGGLDAGRGGEPFPLKVEENQFPTSLLEIILSAWNDGTPLKWDLYERGIRFGHFGLLKPGIDGVNAGNLVQNPGEGINGWFNRLIADPSKHGITTVEGLSQLVDASLIALGMDNAFVQNYSKGKRRDVPEIVKALAANGNRPELSWSMEGNNSVLTVKLADYVLPPVKFNGPMYDFEIRFDGNLGYGKLDPIGGFDGEPIALPNKTAASAFARQWWWEPAGWNLKKGGDDQKADLQFGESFRSSASGDSVTLYVAWGRKDATLKFDMNGQPGTAPSAKTGKLGSGIPLPSVASGPSNKFLGWADVKTDPEYVESAGSPHLLTENRTMYAVWEEHPQNDPPAMVSVTFNANYGSQDSMQVAAKAGIVIELPSSGSFERDGYNFVGWSTVSSGGTVFPSQSYFKLGDENAVFYAQWSEWKPAPFRTVTLNSNDGTGRTAELEPIPEGTVISLPLAGFTWEFHDLVGWHRSAIDVGNGQSPKPDYVPGDSFTVNADSTLYEVWVWEKFTVNFVSEYLTSNFPPIDVMKGEYVTLPTSENYGKEWELVGWRSETDGNILNPGAKFQPTAKTTTFTAVWEKLSSEITFPPIKGGGTVYMWLKSPPAIPDPANAGEWTWRDGIKAGDTSYDTGKLSPGTYMIQDSDNVLVALFVVE